MQLRKASRTSLTVYNKLPYLRHYRYRTTCIQLFQPEEFELLGPLLPELFGVLVGSPAELHSQPAALHQIHESIPSLQLL
jgi:hypothetical protein